MEVLINSESNSLRIDRGLTDTVFFSFSNAIVNCPAAGSTEIKLP
jgi:hypothetical protein